MLTAYVDDSGRGNPPVYVLAGLVAKHAAWDAFSERWAEVLQLEPSLSVLKMKEYMKAGIWIDSKDNIKLPKLYAMQEVINQYVEYGVCVAFPNVDYREIFNDAVPKIWRSEYYYATTKMIEGVLAAERERGRSEKVDFVFDTQLNEESEVELAWNRAKSRSPRLRRKLGSISWGDDAKLRPLQACDMLAWLTRRMAADMLGDAGVISPAHKGKPLYDPSILNMGFLQNMSQDEEASPQDYHALALRMSSKAWPGGMAWRIPVYGQYHNRDALRQDHRSLLTRGTLKISGQTAETRAR